MEHDPNLEVETPAPRGMRLEALVGFGVAGLLVGALVAAWGASAPAEPPRNDGAQAATVAGSDGREGDLDSGAIAAPGDGTAALAAEAAKRAALAPVIAALEDAHHRLHGPDDAQPVADGAANAATALKDAVRAQKLVPKLRLEVHEAVGPGALATASSLSPAAESILIWVEQVEDHAIRPEPYGRDTLKALVDAHRAGATGQAVRPPEEAGSAGPVLLSLLRAPGFDAADAERRLIEAKGTPTAAQIEALATALAANRRGPEAEARAAKVEAALLHAATRLALDFKFLRVAGPFKLRRTAEKVVADKKRRRALMTLVQSLAEAPDAASFAALLTPAHPDYTPMKAAYGHYRAQAEAGGCPDLPTNWRLRMDMKGVEVEKLQRRLACELLYEGEFDGVFDADVKAAVQNYQRDHELSDGGFAYKETLASMNVPMKRRAEKIALTLQRLRESRIDGSDARFIRVNVPAFEIQLINRDEGILVRHRAIVGTNRLDDDKVKLIQGHINRTALFKTDLYQVIINPDWVLPERVEKGEVKGKLAEDPDYLAKNNIRKKTMGGREVLVQGSGKHNVLGKVKFILEKSNAIFLHDTNKRWLFKEQRRDFSHGCIRVHEAVDFARRILIDDGWAASEIDRALGAKTTQRGLDLKRPIPVITEYMTVHIGPEGRPIFLTDIYRYDRAFEQGTLPPKSRSRWGHVTLRPAWVPMVKKSVVDDWRASGKPAPRNYDPTKGSK